MSVVFSGTMQGSFVSSGTPELITLRSDFDWIHVRNQTVSYAAGTGDGAEFFFDKWTMTNGRGTVYTKLAAAGNPITVGQIAANSGFFLYDSSITQPAGASAITSIAGGGVPPVILMASTAGYFVGDTIRIYNTDGALQLGGIDFTVTALDGTHLTLGHMHSIVAAAGPGTIRKIPFDPIYYPRTRIISHVGVANAAGNVAAAGNDPLLATQALVAFTVTHGYHVGQKLNFRVPEVTALAFGMTQLDGLTGTVIAVGDTFNPSADVNTTNTVRIDIDVSSFTAFAWPLTASNGDFTPAQAAPAGLDLAVPVAKNLGVDGSAYFNTAVIGVLLMPGALSPAGVQDDVIEWIAGKSWNK